jgi:hypothetical protein
MWADVRRFLENPGEVLERVRAQRAADDGGELVARRAKLEKRLAASSAEKDRYVRLYAKGHLSEEDLDLYLRDLANQIDNLRLLLESVEEILAAREQDRLAAKSTEAWLMTLRERIAEVEEVTEEAFGKRRQLVKLLVQRIDADRDEDGSTQVRITYRFGPPSEAADDFSHDGAGFTSNITTKKTTPAPASWPLSSPRTSADWALVGF